MTRKRAGTFATPALLACVAWTATAHASAGTVTLAPGARANTAVLAVEQAPFTADHARGVVAWSAYDPAIEAYRLRVRAGGATQTAAIPSRERAFDVDVGRGPDGRVVAVYSRCEREGELLSVEPPDGCDLFLYDIAARTERRIRASSSRAHSETLPSISGDRIAFVRAARNPRAGRRARKDVVYIGRVTGRPASVRQPGGPASSFRAAVEELELASGRLYFTWSHGYGGTQEHETLYRVVGRRAIPLYATESRPAHVSNLVGLTYTGPYLYFGETNAGVTRTSSRLFRSSPTGRDLREAVGARASVSAVWTGRRFLLARNPNDPRAAADARRTFLEARRPVWRPVARFLPPTR